MNRCLALVALFVSSAFAETIDIDVIGLFKGRAMLEINGTRTLLQEGETSDEGVRLIRANSREAIINLGGEDIRLDLSSRIGTRYAIPSQASVTIQINDLGQYRTRGSINGRPTAFVIDTGANVVAMNRDHARALGIDITSARETEAVTAGGRIRSWQVTIAEVQVGGIRVENVHAAVLQGSFPEEILLGMTFLNNVKIQESSGVLVLTSEL